MRLNTIFFVLFCSVLISTVQAQTGEELFEMGNLEFDGGNFTQAIQYWEKAREADPSLAANSWYNTGLAYAGMEMYEEAIKAWDRTIGLAPESPIAYDNRGTALAILGRNEEAIESYNKAILLDPEESKYKADRDMLINSMKNTQSPLSPLTALVALLVALGCVLGIRRRF